MSARKTSVVSATRRRRNDTFWISVPRAVNVEPVEYRGSGQTIDHGVRP
jgi:hypothetical protein